MNTHSVSGGCLVVALMVFSSPAPGQAPAAEAAALPRLTHSVVASATPNARQALGQLGALVTQETYRDLGFESKEEISRSEVGEPMHVYMVRLDHLRSFESKSDPDKLLTETNEAIFPVRVAGQVRTGLTMRLVAGKWQFSSFGASPLIRALSRTSEGLAGRSKSDDEGLFAVRIPALHAYFVGHREQKALFLTAAADDVRFKLKQGETLPAEKVFAALAPYAREYKTGAKLVD